MSIINAVIWTVFQPLKGVIFIKMQSAIAYNTTCSTVTNMMDLAANTTIAMVDKIGQHVDEAYPVVFLSKLRAEVEKNTVGCLLYCVIFLCIRGLWCIYWHMPVPEWTNTVWWFFRSMLVSCLPSLYVAASYMVNLDGKAPDQVRLNGCFFGSLPLLAALVAPPILRTIARIEGEKQAEKDAAEEAAQEAERKRQAEQDAAEQAARELEKQMQAERDATEQAARERFPDACGLAHIRQIFFSIQDMEARRNHLSTFLKLFATMPCKPNSENLADILGSMAASAASVGAVDEVTCQDVYQLMGPEALRQCPRMLNQFKRIRLVPAYETPRHKMFSRPMHSADLAHWMAYKQTFV